MTDLCFYERQIKDREIPETMINRNYFSNMENRKRQIDTLKIFNDNVIEIEENCEYRIQFNLGRQNAYLDVILGHEFPNEKPIILINPAFSHPWIAKNSNAVTGAPGLLNYTVHSDLGRIVQAIIREFMRMHEEVGSPQSSGNEECPLTPHSMYQDSASSPVLAFSELSNLSNEELQEIADNPDLQYRFLETLPQTIELDMALSELMNKIELLAQDNLSKQRKLEDLKTSVISRISKIIQLKSNYEELNRKHQKLSEIYDPYKIREFLYEAAVKADEDAETVVEQFLVGNIGVDNFVNCYTEKRALGQMRRAREERLAHQLLQLAKENI